MPTVGCPQPLAAAALFLALWLLFSTLWVACRFNPICSRVTRAEHPPTPVVFFFRFFGQPHPLLVRHNSTGGSRPGSATRRRRRGGGGESPAGHTRSFSTGAAEVLDWQVIISGSVVWWDSKGLGAREGWLSRWASGGLSGERARTTVEVNGVRFVSPPPFAARRRLDHEQPRV